MYYAGFARAADKYPELTDVFDGIRRELEQSRAQRDPLRPGDFAERLRISINRMYSAFTLLCEEGVLQELEVEECKTCGVLMQNADPDEDGECTSCGQVREYQHAIIYRPSARSSNEETWDTSLAGERIAAELDGAMVTGRDQPWLTELPQFESVCRDELQEYAKRIPVLLVTVTDVERKAVMRLMQPTEPGGRRMKGYIGQQTYFCGNFGAYRAALTTCTMGAIGRDAAILSIQQAIQDLSPAYVIMVGIAYGKDPHKQHIGQVLVASHVISYEQQRVSAGKPPVHRGTRGETSGILINRFRNLDGWGFLCPDGSLCKYEIGPILSGDKLIDDPVFKEDLFDKFPDAIGGEMEGAGLYAAAERAGVPWILVKAICDWGDGTKTDRAQPLAAAAAASLVHTVLSDPNTLDGIKHRPSMPVSGFDAETEHAPRQSDGPGTGEYVMQNQARDLTKLLHDVFDADVTGLLKWIRLELGKQIYDELPSNASLADLAFQAVLAIGRHGRADAELFQSLRALRPHLATRIREVASLWGVTLAAMGSADAAALPHAFGVNDPRGESPKH